MPTFPPTSAEDVVHESAHAQLWAFLDEHRRRPLPLRWVYPHLLRELAQHCGHADILREQLLAE